MNTDEIQVTGIFIYPVKSLAGIALKSAVVETRGLQYDRRWMVVDTNGRFLTQRDYPKMALIGTAIEPPFLVLFDRRNSIDRVSIPLAIASDGAKEYQVKIWDDKCVAVAVSTAADAWLSEKLGAQVQLVGMPSSSMRPTDPRYAPENHPVSFADGFPFLIIGEATLADLNSRLVTPVPMTRFRPNIVFAGATAFAEDGFGHFDIGNQRFQAVKPCARCMITTIDQESATKNPEPLLTLSLFRKKENKVFFGQNLIWWGTEGGTIQVGDKITSIVAK